MRHDKKLLLSLAVLTIACLCLASCDNGERQRLQLEELEGMNRAGSLMTNDSLALELVRYFDDHGTRNEQMRAHYLLGRTYYDCGKLPDALEAFHAAAACAAATSDDCDFHTLSMVHIQMAEIFHRHYQPLTAIAELKEAQRLAYLDNDTLLGIECYFDQSNEYERLGEVDSAFAISTEAARLFTAMGQHDRAAAAKSSTALMLLDQHRTDEAKAAIDAFLSSSYTDSLGNVSPGREIFYYKRGLYYLQEGKLDSAEYFFRRELREGLDVNNQIAGRKGLQLLYGKLNKADSVAKYASEGYSLSDSVYMVSESQNVQSLQAMFDYTRYERQAHEEREIALQSKLRFLWTSLFALILLIVFILLARSYLYVQRKRVEEQKQYGQLQETYMRLEQELSALRDFQQGSRQMPKEHQTALADSQRATEDILRVRQCEQAALQEATFYASLIQKTNMGRELSDDDWTAIRKFVREMLPQFHHFITTRECLLTDYEVKMSLLVRLYFKPKNIACALGLDSSYVTRVRRSLLKKMFAVSGNSKDADSLIRQIDHLKNSRCDVEGGC